MKTKRVSTKTNQNAKGIVANLIANASSFDIPIAKIVANPHNPRKQFDETQLDNLAANINAVGLIQPVLVRPCKDSDMYELIVGERRYRAMQKAQKKVVPGFIRDIPDDLARRIAVSENIERVDLTPIEEAHAFQAMLESNPDKKALSADCGVSETYINNRLNLLRLIPDIAALLIGHVVSIGAALELSRYPENTQENVYKSHLKDNCTGISWRPMKVKELARKLAENYSQRLSDYEFDKSACENCQYNTASQELFKNTNFCHCQNRACLEEKNNSYLIAEAVRLLADDPALTLAQCSLTENKAVMQHLSGIGYTPVTVDWHKSCMRYDTIPFEPVKPRRKDYNSAVAFQNAIDLHDFNLSKYQEKEARIKEGTLKRYLVIAETYLRFITEDLTEKTEIEKVTIQSETEQLQKKDELLRAKRDESIVTEMRDFIVAQKVPRDPISKTEQQICLYLLYKNLASEYEELMGFRKELTIDRVANLKPEQRIKIMRGFIFSQIFDFGDLGKEFRPYFHEYCEQRYPEKFAEVKAMHEKKYQNKHTSIEKRLIKLAAEEQAAAVIVLQLPKPEQPKLPPVVELMARPVAETVPLPGSRAAMAEDVEVLALLPEAASPDQPQEVEQAVEADADETTPAGRPTIDPEVAEETTIEAEIISEAPQPEPEIVEVSAEVVESRTETMPVPVSVVKKKQGKNRKRSKSKSAA